MLAKNRRTLLKLHDAFRSRAVAKRYEVVVAGTWPAKLRRVDAQLKRYALPSGERRVRVASDGEPARTDFEIVARLAQPATWLAAFPKTGRTHQIRVHAAASGHPVLGDDKYAVRGAEGSAAGRLMLHASRLRLVLDGRTLRFEAPLPAAFERLRPAD
jgi:23S rRNA pseudouridine955/2504/2580 synthase